MKKYNVFSLCVVNVNGYNFICEKNYYDDKYFKEIFTNERIKASDIKKAEPLADYYSLLAVKNYLTGKPLMLTKKTLLIKYAELNSHNIELKKQDSNYMEKIIKEREEYSKALKKLAEVNPEKAKEIAIETLRKSGILDENNELAEPYKESVEHVRTLKNI